MKAGLVWTAGFILVASALIATNAATGTLEQDKAALLEFKSELDSFDKIASLRGWRGWNLTGSADDVPVCDWSAVECDPTNQTVIAIHIYSGKNEPKAHTAFTGPKRISGELGSALEHIQNLKSIEIREQLLYGTLPESWAAGMPHLEFIDLEGNQLTGFLPEAWGGPNVFQNLTYLYLYGNNFESNEPPLSWFTKDAFPRLNVSQP